MLKLERDTLPINNKGYANCSPQILAYRADLLPANAYHCKKGENRNVYSNMDSNRNMVNKRTNKKGNKMNTEKNLIIELIETIHKQRAEIYKLEQTIERLRKEKK